MMFIRICHSLFIIRPFYFGEGHLVGFFLYSYPLEARAQFDIRRPGCELDNSAAFGREYCQIILDQLHDAVTIFGSPIQRRIAATVAQHRIGHPEPPIEASVADTAVDV